MQKLKQSNAKATLILMNAPQQPWFINIVYFMVCGSGCVWMLSLLRALQLLPVLWEAKLLHMLYSHITRVSLFKDRGVQLNSTPV